MTTINQVRKAALGLPETEETTHFGMVAFAVRGKGFASVTEAGIVQLYLPGPVADEVLARHPGWERLVRMGTPIGVSVPLGDVNGQELNALVRASWASRAPKRLAASLAAVDAGEVPDTSDLPPAIGRAATRALLNAGVITLDDVATRSESELLALHGLGPKAVRVLADALAERGRTLPRAAPHRASGDPVRGR